MLQRLCYLISTLDKLIERGHTMAVLFYDPNDKQDLIILDDLEKIDDDCRRFDIDFIKVSDAEEATQYGMDNVTRLSTIVEILKN